MNDSQAWYFIRLYLDALSDHYLIHDQKGRKEEIGLLKDGVTNFKFSTETDIRLEAGAAVGLALTQLGSDQTSIGKDRCVLQLDTELMEIQQSVLDAIASATKVVIGLNSPGGNGSAALKLLDALNGKDVTINAAGKTASAAALVFSCCHGKRVIDADASLKFHSPVQAVVGNAQAFRRYADELEAMENEFTKRLAARSKLPESFVKDMLSGDRNSIFTAEMAVATGLADEVL